MLRNFFRIAIRNLMKHKIFSFINVFGLSVGLASCLLISVYLKHELSYDKGNPGHKNIYQLGTVFIRGTEENASPNTPGPMAGMMKQEYPEIEETTRVLGLFAEDKTLLRYQDNGGSPTVFYETKGFLVDPTFFHFFNYPMKEGDAAHALDNPHSLVVNEEIAKKMFGDQPALNKVIHISSGTNGEADYIITGVFKEPNVPSSIDGRFFISFKGGDMDAYVAKNGDNIANNNMFATYLKLKPDADAQQLEAKFPAFIDKYAGKDLKAAGFGKKQFLTPIADIHLYSKSKSSTGSMGSVTYLYILGSIAVFSLLIACINFMNLSTARSSKRAAEVGVRKVLGAEKAGLIRQFLFESVLMSVIAFVIGLLLAMVLLPAFGTATGKVLTLSFLNDLWMIAAFFGLSVFTGLIAGIYPALYLSSFKPIKILKTKSSNSFATISLRKGLVVFQFIISCVLIISSVVIERQMHYMRSADLGFIKDQELIIPLRSESARASYHGMKTELSKLSSVESIGASLYYPGIANPQDGGLYREGQTAEDVKSTKFNIVDANFVQTLGIKPIAGRLFSEDIMHDTANGIILNETAIKAMGFASPQDALGDKVYAARRDGPQKINVVGVVKDFHFQDLHLPIAPYGFLLNSDDKYNYIMVHSRPGAVASLLSEVKGIWHKFNPNEPLDYNFLDEQFEKNYKAQDQLASMVRYFTFIAIFISCLGLFGLATFSAEQRIKEIGVRKVLGASVTGIVSLLSTDFIKLVLIALVIASPLAWYIMHKWLMDFAYRAPLDVSVFVISAIIAMLIALFTISFQTVKAAIANPVKSLRSE